MWTSGGRLIQYFTGSVESGVNTYNACLPDSGSSYLIRNAIKPPLFHRKLVYSHIWLYARHAMVCIYPAIDGGSIYICSHSSIRLCCVTKIK